MMNNILELRQLSFGYRQQKILDNLTLGIPKGSIYGYLGKNGSGKTTTMKLILGILDAPPNTVYFYGQEFKKNREKILKKVGNLVESPCYYENLTGLENLAYLDIIYKCGIKQIEKVLNLVGLTGDRNKKVKKYSTGMKQRLGIAMALFHDPDFLILDEPLNGLDPEGIHEVRELMIKLKGEGKTILFSSHILAEIEKTCTHISLLDKGNLLYQGDIKKLLCCVERKIFIKTNKAQYAHLICNAHSIVSFILSDEELLVKLESDIDHNRLIQLFVSNKIDIYSVELKENNLESVFLHLTSN
ncbi:ABC transporter ATP-binding protein [Dysgonomonas sp. ZJ279]|uniref:ABC transporter ATP-binding protein n=1 Tax=Dysgonomonas sp. ZJ279 TaxID=2709796 RepID=UPI002107C2FD|nr:ATP-binding cassette domain-containing protein [Dysgonomonas sp. ZJ279]